MMREYQLRIGTKATGLVLRPDDRHPNMWRIHYRGEVSDMVNLARAKEAAVSWVRPRGLGGGERKKWDHREMRSGRA
jgi:hypothetical protein